jgi:5'-methylthioadenosine phosphorylase
MTTLIFGGTAAYHLKLHEYAAIGERRIIPTPFGESSPFVQLTTGHTTAWFNSRHGEDGLQRSAAFVNHRANIWAARELGATGIISWNGVGAIAPGLAVGQLVVPDDMLDMTRARTATFGEQGSVPYTQHIDTTRPFSESLRAALLTACAELGSAHATHGIYVCTEGPRLETAAEIALFGWGGAAVVGMTLAPEVWLAAELGIPYASLCIVTNMATGRWQFDPRRDFGPGVGVKGLQVTLAAVRQL